MALRTPAFNDAKTYGFEWLRAMLETGLQEGVIGGTDLKVTAAAAGAPLRVDIAAGVALVKGDSGVPATGLSQGLYLTVNDAAVANAVALTAAHATLPRLDAIVQRVRDSSDLGTGADDVAFDVITGVATAGATLDNRNGAVAIPNDCLHIGDVLVAAASTAVVAGNVRDRRKFARGFSYYTQPTNGFVDKTTTSGAFVDVDATLYAPRCEFSGVPVEATFRFGAVHSTNSTVGAVMDANGSQVTGSEVDAIVGSAGPNTMTIVARYAPAAGSAILKPRWLTGVATATMKFSTNQVLPTLSIREDLRPNANNS